MSVADSSYWPDSILLKHGLEASEVLRNTDLASDLLWRAVVNYIVPSEMEQSVDGTLSQFSPLYNEPQISIQDFAKGMLICIGANDMKACDKILSCAEKQRMSPGSMRSLYLLNLKGYANAGDTSSAEKLLEKMKEKNLNPGYVQPCLPVLGHCCCVLISCLHDTGTKLMVLLFSRTR